MDFKPELQEALNRFQNRSGHWIEEGCLTLYLAPGMDTDRFPPRKEVRIEGHVVHIAHALLRPAMSGVQVFIGEDQYYWGKVGLVCATVNDILVWTNDDPKEYNWNPGR